MKRSEMINILDEVINSKLYQDYLFDKSDLEEVLLAIEKAGMLPPFTYLTKIKTLDTAWEPEE
jgi:hypothetical protein